MRLRNILILLVVLLALGGYFYFTNRPEPPPKPEAQLYVWLIDMDMIKHIEIRLPPEDKSQRFVKEADRTWHFDDPQKTPVDMQRWGGGIPLLLSGPATKRVIATNATEEKLAEFGLTQPQMEITLTLENGEVLNISVGKSTPDGMNYYLLVPDSKDVALVDFTWYEVLARLVREPPYITPSQK